MTFILLSQIIFPLLFTLVIFCYYQLVLFTSLYPKYRSHPGRCFMFTNQNNILFAHFFRPQFHNLLIILKKKKK